MKRFTETTKWADPWFRSLKPQHKLLYLWIIDNCDCAGMLPEIDFGLVSFQIGFDLTETDLVVLGDRIQQSGRQFFIPKFVAYQYGSNELNPKSSVHRGIAKALERVSKAFPNPYESLTKGFDKGYLTLKDKDKDKDKIDDEVEEKKVETDEQWIIALAADSTYAGIDVKREFGKMSAWCATNKKQASRRRFVNWLNRVERPMGAVNQDEFGSVRSKAW